MAKKTEKELIDSIRRLGTFGPNGKHIVTLDKVEDGHDMGVVSIINKSNKLVDEIRGFKATKDVEAKNISKSNFKAYFTNEELPQSDEIISVTFRPDDGGEDKLLLDIVFAPKRKLYFDMLTTHYENEPFIVELKNKDGETVDKIKMYLTTAQFALSDPIKFEHHRNYVDSFINDDTLTYELEFDFTID